MMDRLIKILMILLLLAMFAVAMLLVMIGVYVLAGWMA